MPYHIHIRSKGKDYYEYDQWKNAVEKLSKLYLQRQEFPFSGIRIVPDEIERFRVFLTPNNKWVYDANRVTVWDSGRDVTRDFIDWSTKTRTSKVKISKKDIFIVHGRDHDPVKELKVMLKGFGLNPIVLHEKPSGSRTIIEKLEKYSDVGYAFVVLTPDDQGYSYKNGLESRILNRLRILSSKLAHRIGDAIIPTRDLRPRNEVEIVENLEGLDRELSGLFSTLKARARQNVILEFGYFMGLLSRDRVCCLHKGEVELPSDMHGIVYIPFKESVNEVREEIIKELKEAGYEIKM